MGVQQPDGRGRLPAGAPHSAQEGVRRGGYRWAHDSRAAPIVWHPGEWVECPAGISAQIMGHKPSATAEKHYRRRPLDLLRQWHTKIEAWILAEAGVEQPAAGEAPALVAVGAGK